MAIENPIQGELFEIAARGALAEALICAGKTPSTKHWAILRGEKDLTVRDIGEIAGFAGCGAHLSTTPKTQEGE